MLNEEQYFIIHPLDDIPEKKVDTASLGEMTMTKSVRLSLFALRFYLIIMGVLTLYHVLDLAGILQFF